MEFLLGTWKGQTKTWFDPEGEAELGTLETRFQKTVGDLFIEEIYTGTIGEKAHEGRRIFGSDERVKETTLYWMDSFHTGPTAIHFRGPESPQSIAVEGHFYGGDEKWGWRIEFMRLTPDTLEMKHFVIAPGKKPERAIECLLKRV